MKRIAIDIGGTFTDVVAYDEMTAGFLVGKVPSDPSDLAGSVIAGFDSLAGAEPNVSFLVHGTTVGLNALLERRGARVLLLATRGAGDVYHIARGHRGRLYDIHYRKPTPLVPLADVIEIGGRFGASGAELEPLDEAAVRQAAARFRDDGFEAVAVAYLFSYLRPEHELRTEEILREELGAASISLSHRVAREWREYERTSTTVIDAYTGPVVRSYLRELEQRLSERGVDAEPHVMQSNGGLTTATAARSRPVDTLLSGPVGCTVGAQVLSRTEDVGRLLCIDMGGTSFDVSMIVDGRPDVAAETALHGLPLLLSVVKIHTIGAGGGSIVHLDANGLHVGPRSAGAFPGPACYGRGGTEPTVTDANLLLGRIDETGFSGGAVSLDRHAAEQALHGVAKELDLETIELAEGVCRIVNATMAQAIRTITVDRGIEPGDFTLLACGGAGALHAPFLAAELGIGTVLVPPAAGAFSAWGMLQTEIRHDVSRSFRIDMEALERTQLDRIIGELSGEVVAAVEDDGVAAEKAILAVALDMRYRGQEHTISVALEGANGKSDASDGERLLARFHAAHRTQFGYATPETPAECVAVRVSAYGSLKQGRIPPEAAIEGANTGQPDGPTRQVVFGGRARPTQMMHRGALTPGTRVDGPAVISEATSTSVVPPGWSALVRPSGALILRVEDIDA